MTFSKKRTFIGVFLVVFAIIATFFSSLSGFNVSAAEDYHKWRQTDARWGSITMGSSDQTVAKSGCLVTSIAILAVHSGSENPENFNPGVLANRLNSVSGFSYGAIASWAKINEVMPNVRFEENYYLKSSDKSGKAKEILSFINKGYYVTCDVGGHWVFVDGVKGDKVSMIDPAKDDTDMFASYGDYCGYELKVFSGKYPAVNGAAEPATAAPTTEKWKKGEYYSVSSSIKVHSSDNVNSKAIEVINEDCVVKVNSVKGDMGCIQLGNDKGWVDLNKFSYAGDSIQQLTGDINNDGVIDTVDITLLNEYISSLSELPDGISLLRECEIKAADINGDGVVDNNDVLEYLALVCE